MAQKKKKNVVLKKTPRLKNYKIKMVGRIHDSSNKLKRRGKKQELLKELEKC